MASFIPPEEIEAAAIGFLAEHHPENTIPTPIEDIIDVRLGIDIAATANLMRLHGIDGFITRDLSTIYIDLELYQTIDRNFRARNTLAHEIGHYVLHGQYIAEAGINSVEDWKHHQRTNSALHDNLETQARIFASYCLMPTEHLETRFEHYKAIFLEKAGAGVVLPEDRKIAPFVASHIGRDFNVSEQSADLRLQKWLEYRPG